MSAADRINPIGSIAVDGGTAYAVQSITRQQSLEGPEQLNTHELTAETWTLNCVAQAASADDISDLWDTIKADLVSRGKEVVLTDRGTATTLAADAMPGFPRVRVADLPQSELSAGASLAFTVTVEARVPNSADADTNGVIVDDRTTTTRTDVNGLVTTTIRGTIRTAAGTDAKTVARDTIVPALIAAATGGLPNVLRSSTRFTQGIDTTRCEYELQLSPRNINEETNATVNEVEIDDTTAENVNGEIVRTVRGFVIGVTKADAIAYAAAQEPAEDANNVLTRRRISAPKTPSGRVDFAFDLITGVTSSTFSGVRVTSFRESISHQSGGSPIQEARYFTENPSLLAGRRGAHVYVQSTDIGFIGDWSALDSQSEIGLLMAATAIDGVAVISKRSEGKIKRVSMAVRYVFAAAQTTPNPRTVAGVTASGGGS